MKRLLPLAIFVPAYMAIALTLALRRGNTEFLFYAAAMALCIAGVLWVDRRTRFTTPVLWCLALWGMLHMFGGTLPIPASVTDPPEGPYVLYNLRPAPFIPKFDQLVHAFGFFTATLAAWHALRAASRHTLRPTLGPLLACALIGMGLGAVNEVIEFIATRLIPDTNVGGYENTGWDLVSNLVGAALAALLIRALAARGASRERDARIRA
ncbi:MAG: DUF2238 domain-containing protein [Phycisphaerales bacterium]